MSQVTVRVMVALEITWPIPVVLLMLTVDGEKGDVEVVPEQAAYARVCARHMNTMQTRIKGARQACLVRDPA
ncbi:hypothetical protein [Cupriavidus sp. BIC8F]|uniref:hypothetical protein n=1 Tax=Cupriavidus sp. BIC8F TaxID=3079014 RepID=UPI002915E9BA|nr:hypothetical protein [Cupriavidus sp. BIC8F]